MSDPFDCVYFMLVLQLRRTFVNIWVEVFTMGGNMANSMQYTLVILYHYVGCHIKYPIIRVGSKVL